jgi:hypothetical protein
MTINGHQFHPRFMQPVELAAFRAWLQCIVAGEMHLRLEYEMGKAMERPDVLRVLAVILTGCTEEDARTEIREHNASEWLTSLSRFFEHKPVVFSGTAEEQAAALEAHLKAVAS